MTMPTAGSRLNLLAQAEKHTGLDLGYRKTWEATALVLRERYSNQRMTYRRLHPIMDPVKGLTALRC